MLGPHNGATFCNIPRYIEKNVGWVTGLISYMRDKNLSEIQPGPKVEEDWTIHLDELAQMALFPTANSWFMDVNVNDPTRKRMFMLYVGGAPSYKNRCYDMAAKDYEGVVWS